MTEPVNNQWLTDILNNLSSFIAVKHTEKQQGYAVKRRTDDQMVDEATQAILSKLESIEQEAYKKGYVDGGIEILNASCEVCHAYPMTADCNNANCHAIER